MTQEEIKEYINKKFNEYLKTPFDQILPPWFCQRFEVVFMNANQAQIPYFIETIQSIFDKVKSKNTDTLSILEVKLMATIYLQVAPVVIEKNPQSFFVKRGFIQSVIASIEKLEDDKKTALARESYNLNQIQNPGYGKPKTNPLIHRV